MMLQKKVIIIQNLKLVKNSLPVFQEINNEYCYVIFFIFTNIDQILTLAKSEGHL